MKSSDFQPMYDDSVVGYLPASVYPPWPISKFYCLLPASANLMATLFDPQPEIFFAQPSQQAEGSPFRYSGLVPWFRFTTLMGQTIERNAGQLATYWGMVGVSDPLAQAKIDIGIGS
jgi:hypothetical protein